MTTIVTTKTSSCDEFSFRAEGALTESAKNTVYLELRVSAWRSNPRRPSEARTDRVHLLKPRQDRAGPRPDSELHYLHHKCRGPRRRAATERAPRPENNLFLVPRLAN